MDHVFHSKEVIRLNALCKYYKSLKFTIKEKVVECELDLDNLTELKNIMCLDVETSRKNNLIQISYNIYDSKFRIIKSYDTLIDDGIGEIDFFEKYTLDEIMLCGVSSREAFQIMQKDINKCSHVVGHNISFDMRHINNSFEKLRIPYNKPETICTMRLTADFCKLPGKRKAYKIPKLAELYFKCFDKEPDTTRTHTAEYDIEITWDCFKYLYNNNIIKL